MALKLSMQQNDEPAAQQAGQGAQPQKPSRSKRKRKKISEKDETEGAAGEELAAPKQRKEADEENDEKERKEALQKRDLAIAQNEVDAMFDFLAGGKPTIGLPDFVTFVNRFGLDIDDDMVNSAFEFLHKSPFTGPCNQIDRAAFRAFVAFLK